MVSTIPNRDEYASNPTIPNRDEHDGNAWQGYHGRISKPHGHWCSPFEPVALNNHPRRWPKDQNCDLQSRHRQRAATRSLSQPIITGTYSVKCSPLFHSPFFFLFFFFTEPPHSYFFRSFPFVRTGTREPLLYLSVIWLGRPTIIRVFEPALGWTASLISSNYAGRLKRFNCPTRRIPCSGRSPLRLRGRRRNSKVKWIVRRKSSRLTVLNLTSSFPTCDNSLISCKMSKFISDLFLTVIRITFAL